MSKRSNHPKIDARDSTQVFSTNNVEETRMEEVLARFENRLSQS